MSLDNMPFNWFDAVLLGFVVLGLHRGRKHGMSEELIGVLKWLTIVFVCAFAYQPLGNLIATSPVFGALSGYLMAYFACMLVIAIAFAYLKKAVGGKLLGSDVFGRTEFYLGMLAGVVRFSCVLIAGLAMLNARLYTRGEVQDELNYQNDVYGSHFFPTLQTVQSQVFERSMTGPWIKDRLSILLIKPTAPEKKELKQKEFVVPG
jgi:uncharacterized membrane protein required for colicin V production